MSLTRALFAALISNVFVLMENQRLHLSLNELTTFSDPPPISRSQAIDIALKYGGWNETSLKDYVVRAELASVMFSRDNGRGHLHLHDIAINTAGPDYQERHFGNTTFRYVWIVSVLETGPHKSIPPPGYHIVDVLTGKVYNRLSSP